MRRKIVTVLLGPSAWVGLRGWLISEDGDFIVGKFWSRDDSGESTYKVRMPRACVSIEEEPVKA